MSPLPFSKNDRFAKNPSLRAIASDPTRIQIPVSAPRSRKAASARCEFSGAAWSQFQDDEVRGIGIARGLRRISLGSEYDTGPNDWNSVRAAFSTGESVNLTGASGTLDYDSLTGETAAPVNVWTISEDGSGGYELEVLYCVDLSPTPSPDCTEAGGTR